MMLDTGTLRTIRAVALDVDGTIAGADHRVSARTAAAIRGVRDEGLPVFLLTGRSRRSVLELARELGIDNPVAAVNGAVAFDPVSDIDTRTVPMSERDIRATVAVHRATGLALTWWTRDQIWVSELGPISDLLIELNEAEAAIRAADVEDFAPGSILKMMLYGLPPELDAHTAEILAHVPHATRSMDRFTEIAAPEASKWDALVHLLGDAISPEDVLGLGDGGNDVPWLRRIGHPVAMGNARPEVLSIAEHRTAHHAEDGAAVVLEALLDARHSTD